MWARGPSVVPRMGIRHSMSNGNGRFFITQWHVPRGRHECYWFRPLHELHDAVNKQKICASSARKLYELPEKKNTIAKNKNRTTTVSIPGHEQPRKNLL